MIEYRAPNSLVAAQTYRTEFARIAGSETVSVTPKNESKMSSNSGTMCGTGHSSQRETYARERLDRSFYKECGPALRVWLRAYVLS